MFQTSYKNIIILEKPTFSSLSNFKSQGRSVNNIFTVYDTWNSGSSNDADVEREVVCYISFIVDEIKNFLGGLTLQSKLVCLIQSQSLII